MARRTWLLAPVILSALAWAVWLGGCRPSSGKAERAANQPPKGQKQVSESFKKAAGEQKGPEGPQTVGEAAKDLSSGSPERLMNAIRGLGQIVDGPDAGAAQEALSVLLDYLKTAKKGMVRAEVISAISKHSDKYLSIIIPAASDPDPSVRAAAISALGNCSPGSPGEEKLKEFARSSDAVTRSAAIAAMTTLRSRNITDKYAALVSQLGTPDGDASAQAAILLKVAGPAALPALEKAIYTSKLAPQREAAVMCVALICAGTNPSQAHFTSLARVSKKLGEPPKANMRALPILLYAIKDPDPATREIAAQGLGYLGAAGAAPALARALKDPDALVRRRAASALITTPAKPVQGALEATALHDKDAAVRKFAVEALGWIGDPSVTTALAQATRDSSADVRRSAATELGRVKGPTAVDALVGLFKDPDEDVRWAAVNAVADIGDPRTMQQLVQALDDPVPQVSTAAEAGLQRLGISRRNIPGGRTLRAPSRG